MARKTTAARRTPKDEPRPLRGLTYRQRMFVAAYLGEANGNASEAARIAGYACPRISGDENLKKPAIRAAVDAKLASVTLTSDEVLARLGDIASLDVGEYLKFDAQGEPSIDLDAMKRAGKTHLIKAIRYTKFGTVIELHDAMAALELLGKYYRLWVERTEVSGPSGGAISFDLSDALAQVYGDGYKPLPPTPAYTPPERTTGQAPPDGGLPAKPEFIPERTAWGVRGL